MTIKLDARQMTSRDALLQLSSTNPTEVDNLLRAMNAEVTPPFRMRVTSSTQITMDGPTVQNPETLRSSSITPINNVIPTVTTLPVVISVNLSGVTVSDNNSSTPLTFTISTNQYKKVGVSLQIDGKFAYTVGLDGASIALASAPPVPSNTYPIGYFWLFNNGGVVNGLTDACIYQYASGGGAGGGIGDTTEILETLKNDFVDSVYTLMTPSIAKVNGSTLVGTYGSNVSYDLVNNTYKFGTLTGGGSANDRLTSTNLIDGAEFNDKFQDILSTQIFAAWNLSFIDTTATYEVTRDAGIHWSPVSLSRIGASGNYVGEYIWQREEEDSSDVSQTSQTGGYELTGTTGVKAAKAQRFSFSVSSRMVTMKAFMRKSGTPLGNFRLSVYSEISAAPGLLLFTTPWQTCSSLNPSVVSEVSIDISAYSFYCNPSTNYYFVIETDSVYKAGYVTGTASIIIGEATSGANAFDLNNSIWTASALSPKYYFLGYKEAFTVVNEYSNSYTDSALSFNSTTQAYLEQEFLFSAIQVVKKIRVYLNRTAAVGKLYAEIRKDTAGVPSSTAGDVLVTSGAIDISTIGTGSNLVVDIPVATTVLAPGTYHIVLYTDSVYKAGSMDLSWNVDSSSPPIAGSRSTDGISWINIGDNFTYQLLGRSLDLRLRVTGNTSNKYLDAFAAYYSKDLEFTNNTVQNIDKKVFKAVADNLSSFSIGFLPDADLLSVYHVETGQVYKFGAFTLQGYTVVFPTNTFYNGGVETSVTLIFDQSGKTSFDNSDKNALLLANNHLGSTDSSIDRSVPGRGIFLRRPDGTLREICIDDNDDIVVYSV